jgi:hypothetical protein
MHESPSASELIEAVQHYLRKTVASALNGPDAYHARVAANALGIVARELAMRPAADAAEAERLGALIGPGAATADLADAIRAGRIGLETPGLLAHLRATALDQLRVDQPDYSGGREPAAP